MIVHKQTIAKYNKKGLLVLINPRNCNFKKVAIITSTTGKLYLM